MASSEIYEDIKEKLGNVLSDLKVTIKQNDFRTTNGEDRQRLEREIGRRTSQAHVLIKDLEHEVHQAPMSFRAGMNRDIKRLKYELENAERSLEHKQPTYNKSVTFGRGSSSQFPPLRTQDTNEQSTLLLGHKSLHRASESIARSNVVAAESEDVGYDILDNLDQQRDQLIRTRERLEDTDVELTRSKKILQSIHTNIITNRIFLVFFIFIEVGVLIGVCYLKFILRH